MVNARRVGVGGLVVAGLGALVGGCSNTTPAFDNFVAATVIDAGVHRVVNPNVTNVSVGQGAGGYVWDGKYKLEIMRCKDKNSNGNIEGNEILGLAGDSINLDKYELLISLSPTSGDDVTYTVESSNGEVVMRGTVRGYGINTTRMHKLHEVIRNYPGVYIFKVKPIGESVLSRKIMLTGND